VGNFSADDSTLPPGSLAAPAIEHGRGFFEVLGDEVGQAGGGQGTRESEPRSIDLTERAPPAEVLEQMAHCDAINDRLRASGRQLSFALSGDGCSLQIELRDTSGNLLRILSAREALEIAGGADVQ
jgi:hypothetical protein